jgi:EAL domain-containing protein (putative c-di-GMP-specific phosphodiesterase class I)
LGLKVVAEGIETSDQHTFVAAAGVHAIQGDLFARPMRRQDVTAFVAAFAGRDRKVGSGA